MASAISSSATMAEVGVIHTGQVASLSDTVVVRDNAGILLEWEVDSSPPCPSSMRSCSLSLGRLSKNFSISLKRG